MRVSERRRGNADSAEMYWCRARTSLRGLKHGRVERAHWSRSQRGNRSAIASSRAARCSVTPTAIPCCSSGSATTTARSARRARTTADRSPKACSTATRCAAPGTTPASTCAPAKRCTRPRSRPSRATRRERRGTKVVVTGKFERDPLVPSGSASFTRDPSIKNVVIVGAGAAGSAAAEMLRRCGYDGRDHDRRLRRRRAVRSPQSLEGLSRRERAGGMDSASPGGFLRASTASNGCAGAPRASTPRASKSRSRAASR